MPVAKRRAVPPKDGTRRPWTKVACLTAERLGRDAAEDRARRFRFSAPERVQIAFQCPHGDHYHVGLPLACAACEGTGRGKGNRDCNTCKGTGVNDGRT